jgi:hypothetical protein
VSSATGCSRPLTECEPGFDASPREDDPIAPRNTDYLVLGEAQDVGDFGGAQMLCRELLDFCDVFEHLPDLIHIDGGFEQFR